MKRLAEILGSAALFVAVFSAPASAQQRWMVDFETGGVTTGYNDVRIPNETGTLFSLTDDLSTNSKAFWRVRAEVRLAPKHIVSVLAAPLTLHASGVVDRPITFLDEVFPADIPLKATYQFNSYRVTYRYEFVQGEKWKFGVGFTGKIRDAITRVEGGGKSVTKTNVGFVPLLNFRLERVLSSRASLLLEGDAAAAPQGRAEDILAALQIALNKYASLKVGYRLLEGGADVDEVYTFTALHYGVVGLTVRF